MSDPEAKTAAAILATPLDEPERFFPNDLLAVRTQYRELALRFHPDRNPAGSPDVMAHLSALYREAVRRLTEGTWREPGVERLEATDGRQFRLHWRKRHDFELGQLLYSPKVAAFLIGNQHADKFESACRAITGIRYPDRRMEQHRIFLPDINLRFETVDGRCALILHKTPDVFLLADVLAACGGRMDPRHVAWVLNRFYGLLSFLNIIGLTHNGIALNSCWLSPVHHSGLLLGGWWYAAPVGARLNYLPVASHELATAAQLADRKAHPMLDLTCLKALGRELLGDRSGMRLPTSGTPTPMVDFLRQPTTGRAIKDYEIWQEKILPACFGPRQRVELEVTEADIYR